MRKLLFCEVKLDHAYKGTHLVWSCSWSTEFYHLNYVIVTNIIPVVDIGVWQNMYTVHTHIEPQFHSFGLCHNNSLDQISLYSCIWDMFTLIWMCEYFSLFTASVLNL